MGSVKLPSDRRGRALPRPWDWPEAEAAAKSVGPPPWLWANRQKFRSALSPQQSRIAYRRSSLGMGRAHPYPYRAIEDPANLKPSIPTDMAILKRENPSWPFAGTKRSAARSQLPWTANFRWLGCLTDKICGITSKTFGCAADHGLTLFLRSHLAA